MASASDSLLAYIQAHGLHSQPVSSAGIPAGLAVLVKKALPRKPRAVLLDVYGTMLASVSGEVGTAGAVDATDAVDAAGMAMAAGELAERLKAIIADDHARARAAGIAWPEVDAIAVFARALSLDREAAARACVDWECRVNPCAAMPGVLDFLTCCRQSGLPLGIVSNAQFYTALFMRAALGASMRELGFEPELCFWSYLTGRAKPDSFMYRAASTALEGRGIPANEAVFIGNDALNDCAAAGAAGFMTILFAGDDRAFRPRTDMALAMEHPPDSLVSDWEQAMSILL
jgi:putative hydrolase of the HAD superfamily